MSYVSIEQQLGCLEHQFAQVSSALVVGDPVAVETSCAALQQLAVEFFQVLDETGVESVGSALLGRRIRALARGLPQLREALLRRSALVDRGLQLLVPTLPRSTYANSPGLYGSGPKQSGQFNNLSA